MIRKGGICFFGVSGSPAVIRYFRSREDSKATREKIRKVLFSWEEMIHLTVPPDMP